MLKESDIVEDEKIIELLFEHDENGLKELTKKYDLLIKKIAYGILNNNSDTEECEKYGLQFYRINLII